MSYRQATSITETVILTGSNARGEPYSAQVRALRAPEEDAVQAALLGGRKQKASAQTVGRETTTNMALEMDNPAAIETTLLAGIVSWNLDGDPGDDTDTDGILKITARTLQVLTGGDRNALYVAINQLTSVPEQDEKKD